MKGEKSEENENWTKAYRQAERCVSCPEISRHI